MSTSAVTASPSRRTAALAVTAEGGGRRQRSNHRGSEHRRLQTSGNGEASEYCENQAHSDPSAHPVGERTEYGEHERNVLAGDGEEVAEPRRRESCSLLGRLEPILAHHQAQIEGTHRFGDRIRTGHDPTSDDLDQAAKAARAADRFDRVELQSSDQVA